MQRTFKLLLLILILSPFMSFGQDLAIRPMVSHHYQKFPNIKTNTMGGGIGIEFAPSDDNARSTVAFNLMYYAGKGLLTLEDFQALLDTNGQPTDQSVLAKRSNFDLFYLGVDYRFYVQKVKFDGFFIGFNLGAGFPAKDNALGYYWNAGGTIGYQHQLTERFGLDFSINPGFGRWVYNVDLFGLQNGFNGPFSNIETSAVNMFTLKTAIGISFYK